MPRRRYRTDELTPVEKVMLPTRRRQAEPGKTRNECWEAHSLAADGKRDGRWRYRRGEVPGTPWEVVHGEADISYTGMLYSSLDDARHDTHTRPAVILAAMLAEADRIASGAYLPAARVAALDAAILLNNQLRALTSAREAA